MALEKARILGECDREAKERFGVEDVHRSGARSLCVVQVGGPFMLMEYDGGESVKELVKREVVLLD